MKLYGGTEERQAFGDCPAGFQFYTCFKNNFRGCCTVDPCDLGTCPSSLMSAPIVVTTSSSSLSTTATVQTTSTSSSSTTTQTTFVAKSTSSSSSASPSLSSSLPSSSSSSTESSSSSTTTTFTSSSSSSSTIASSLTTTASTAISSSTAINNSSGFPPTITTLPPAHHASNAPIIAGVVSGVVALSILAILIWFCWRRRRQRSDCTYSTPKLNFGIEITKAPESDTSSYDPRLNTGDDVFAPFGGRFRSPRSSCLFSRHSSVGSRSRHSEAGVVQETRQDTSTLQVPIQQNGLSRRESRPERQLIYGSEPPNRGTQPNRGERPDHNEQDTPLADSEKTDITPPDLSKHPVYYNEATNNLSLPPSDPEPSQPVILPNTRYHPVRPRVTSPASSRTELPDTPSPKAERSQNQDAEKHGSSDVNRADTVGSTYTITVGLGSDDRNQTQPPTRSVSIRRMMRPNLNPASEEGETQPGENRRQYRKHVMSWAEYDDAEFTLNTNDNNVGIKRNNDAERWSGSTVTTEKGAILLG